ncbi:hypothetical protein SAMN06298216_0390 [Spirosomataceae bacterium TFI 002]|nr:hypothetical protein SAMN06298216_0390 [Spirosomataceae bacterium TFI 002]
MIKKILTGSTLLQKLKLAAVASTVFAVTSCDVSSENQSELEYDTIEVPTQGVVTQVEETADGTYLITDEKLVDNPDSSKAVVTYADGTTEIIEASRLHPDSTEVTTRRGGSVLRTVMMYSLLSRMMGGGSMGGTPNAGFYKTPEAHSKSSGLSNQMKQSSTSRVVARPRTSSSGFNSPSRSTRSYGG